MVLLPMDTIRVTTTFADWLPTKKMVKLARGLGVGPIVIKALEARDEWVRLKLTYYGVENFLPIAVDGPPQAFALRLLATEWKSIHDDSGPFHLPGITRAFPDVFQSGFEPGEDQTVLLDYGNTHVDLAVDPTLLMDGWVESSASNGRWLRPDCQYLDFQCAGWPKVSPQITATPHTYPFAIFRYTQVAHEPALQVGTVKKKRYQELEHYPSLGFVRRAGVRTSKPLLVFGTGIGRPNRDFTSVKCETVDGLRHLYCAAEFEGELYLGGSDGLARIGESPQVWKTKKDGLPNAEVYELFPTEHGLMIATGKGVVVLRGGKLTSVQKSVVARSFATSPDGWVAWAEHHCIRVWDGRGKPKRVACPDVTASAVVALTKDRVGVFFEDATPKIHTLGTKHFERWPELFTCGVLSQATQSPKQTIFAAGQYSDFGRPTCKAYVINADGTLSTSHVIAGTTHQIDDFEVMSMSTRSKSPIEVEDTGRLEVPPSLQLECMGERLAVGFNDVAVAVFDL